MAARGEYPKKGGVQCEDTGRAQGGLQLWNGGQRWGWTYHVFLNLSPEALHVLGRPISQSLLKVPSRALAQLTLLASSIMITAHTTTTTSSRKRRKRNRALALDRLRDPPLALHGDDALPDQRARRTRLEPSREDVPPGGARGHLEPEVLRPVDELDDRVRRVVPLPPSVLVDARVPARTRRVARRQRLEHFGRERGSEEEGGRFLPRRVRAAFPQRDDLLRACVNDVRACDV